LSSYRVKLGQLYNFSIDTQVYKCNQTLKRSNKRTALPHFQYNPVQRWKFRTGTTNKNNQWTLTKGAQLDVELTKESTIFQIHSIRLTLYNMKPNKSRTQHNNFLISSPEPSPHM